MDYRLQNLKIALLAQLVARGSDKAKVIGSSPVESNDPFCTDCPRARDHSAPSHFFWFADESYVHRT